MDRPPARGLTPDVYVAMGKTAELVARLTGTSRRDQDEWALQSQLRAAAAIDSGYFAREILPYTRRDGTTIAADDGPRIGTTLEGLAASAFGVPGGRYRDSGQRQPAQ